jgi:hypothetical protein
MAVGRGVLLGIGEYGRWPAVAGFALSGAGMSIMQECPEKPEEASIGPKVLEGKELRSILDVCVYAFYAGHASAPLFDPKSALRSRATPQ